MMTSAERMNAAIRRQSVDYVPCSFMIFFNLRHQCPSEEAFVRRQVELGLDAVAHVGYLPPALHPDASETVSVSVENGETVFHRRIDTPAGPLHQRVRQAEGWPTADNFYIFDDYVVPRMLDPLVKPEEDLEKLPYLLGPFRDSDIEALRRSAAAAAVLADELRILKVGGWGTSYDLRPGDDGVMGADAMAWLSGFVDVMVLSLAKPDVIKEYMRILHEWNLRRLEIYLDVTGAELIIRRAWYETTDFWTPAAYRDIIAPVLRREVELVHQADRLFGLIVTSAYLPLLDDILDTGVDVIIGLDPADGSDGDMPAIKKCIDAAGRAVWGGVNGATTVEQGTLGQTAAAVRHALDVLAPGGGFILSPVDNVREETPQVWVNTQAFIDTWKRHRGECAR
jgi:hypothetical protein